MLAAERVLPLPGDLGRTFSDGGLRRGSIVALDGPPGTGTTSIALRLVAAATEVGEWAAIVDLDESIGGVAAAELGVALERLAVVRDVPGDRWASVVAALVDGLSLVVTEVPRHCRFGDARRLVARARERGAVLVVLGPWPADVTVGLHATGSGWTGLEPDGGLLVERTVHVEVTERGATRPGALAS